MLCVMKHYEDTRDTIESRALDVSLYEDTLTARRLSSAMQPPAEIRLRIIDFVNSLASFLFRKRFCLEQVHNMPIIIQ